MSQKEYAASLFGGFGQWYNTDVQIWPLAPGQGEHSVFTVKP